MTRSRLLLRALLLVGFLVLAIRPVLVRPDPGIPAQWAVLVDRSKSMRLKDPTERLSQVKDLLPSFLKKFPHSKLFSFSTEPLPLSEGELKNLPADGVASDMGTALKKVFADGDYRGAVIFTDGRQVGELDPV